MNLQAPQIIYICLVFLSLGISIAEHGQPKKGLESFGKSLIANAIMIGLLYWGGFFS